MQLLTDEIKANLPSFKPYMTDDSLEFHCHAKLFDPTGCFTWYVLAGDETPDGDWHLHCFVDGFAKEYGDVMLSELQNHVGRLGLGIERDLYCDPDYEYKAAAAATAA